MATQIYKNLDFLGVSEIKNAIINPFANLAAMNAYATAQSYGTAQEGIVAYNKNDNKVYVWTGAAWALANSGAEVILNFANAPIDTDVLGTIVSGVLPTNLTADTKLGTWVDAEGGLHLYQVTDPMGTPVFTEITAPKQVLVVTTETTIAGIEALVDFRKNSIYHNETTGQMWMVLEDGNVKELMDGSKEYYGVFALRTLTGGTAELFDVNDHPTLTTSNLVDVLAEEAYSEFLIDYRVYDASNGNLLSNESYEIKPVSTSTFEVTANQDTDVIVSFSFLGSSVSDVIPPAVFNFDVENVDWSLQGVTDKASFESFISTNSNYTSVVANDFDYTTGRIKANIVATGGTGVFLNSMGITKVNLIGGGFNSLTNLGLSINQMSEFNPNTVLPVSLASLALEGNQMTTAGYAASEVWATAQPAFTNPCFIGFTGNVNSVQFTNLETILTSKNAFVIV